MKLFLSLIIPYFLIMNIIFTQEIENPPAKTFTETIITRNIEYFEFKDLSNDIYSLSIISNKADELIEELNGKKNKKLRIEIGDIKTDILVDTAEYDRDNLSMINFSVVAYYKIPIGKTTIKLYSKFNDQPEVLESSKDFIIPESNDLAGKQPFIISITPEGGIRGDTITLTGNNFGKKIDDLVIAFYDSAKKDNGEDTYVAVAESKPFFISVPVNEIQEVKFNIPLKRDLLKGHQIRKSMLIRIFVSGRPSNYMKLTLLPPTWKWFASMVGLFIVILFLIFIYFILRGQIQSAQRKEMSGWDGKGSGIKRPSFIHFIEIILADRATNTYSLSRFQAFAWTITSFGSYIYVVLAQGLILRNGIIPDFNPSLVVLMSISYGGLIAANGLGAKKPKNEIKVKPPELSNLFCEGGGVDLSRLQLFGFTVISILTYVFNLFYGNPLAGLPDVPSTLLGLMGFSQTGYLSGKALGKEISINTVTPDWIQVSQEGVKISVLGSGFSNGSKINLTGNTPIETTFVSQSELTFILPKYDVPAKLTFDLLPPNASPVHCDAEISIVEVGQSGYIVNYQPAEPAETPEVNI